MVDRDDTREIWLPIDGQPGYEVSNLGRVRSLTRTVTVHDNRWGGMVDRTILGKILKQKLWTHKAHAYSCYRIALSQNSIPSYFAVHFLVCRAFHGPRPTPKHEVAHFDGDALNNSEDNLRWATSAENKADTLRHGRRNRGSRHGMAKLTEVDVINIRQFLSQGIRQIDIADRYSVSQAAIKDINIRKNWGWLP